jgi:hypothetical protein
MKMIIEISLAFIVSTLTKIAKFLYKEANLSHEFIVQEKLDIIIQGIEYLKEYSEMILGYSKKREAPFKWDKLVDTIKYYEEESITAKYVLGGQLDKLKYYRKQRKKEFDNNIVRTEDGLIIIKGPSEYQDLPRIIDTGEKLINDEGIIPQFRSREELKREFTNIYFDENLEGSYDSPYENFDELKQSLEKKGEEEEKKMNHFSNGDGIR